MVSRIECNLTLVASVLLLGLSIYINEPTDFDIETVAKQRKICDGVVLSHVIVSTIMNDVGVDPEHYAVLEESVKLCTEGR